MFDFAAQIRSRIFPETGTNLLRIVSRNRAGFFSLFSLHQKIYAESTPTFGAKIHANFGYVFLGVSGLRRCFGMPIFLCWPAKTCKLTISVVGTSRLSSSDTTQRASTQWLGVARAKISAWFPLCLRSFKELSNLVARPREFSNRAILSL